MTHTDTRTSTHAHTHAYVYAYAYAHTHKHTHTHTHARTHLPYISLCIYRYQLKQPNWDATHAYTTAHECTSTCIHVYDGTHAYTCTRTHASKGNASGLRAQYIRILREEYSMTHLNNAPPPLHFDANVTEEDIEQYKYIQIKVRKDL